MITNNIKTFPAEQIPSESGGLAVEIWLIAQLGHGAGNHLHASVTSRQRQHHAFINELDEPSAKLGASDFHHGDASALYSFVIGPNGHPFHRHAGQRVFTAVTGSGGAVLRFSTATTKQIEHDPQNFIRKLRYVMIPPDCLFSLRLGEQIWHSFSPRTTHSRHPTLFALSCHTNELGGNLSAIEKATVLSNEASIPALTELLPASVTTLLQNKNFDATTIPTSTLSLDAPPGTLHRLICDIVRSCAGLLRGTWSAWADSSGTRSISEKMYTIQKNMTPPAASLLSAELADKEVYYEDTFCLSLARDHFNNMCASQILTAVLDGFLQHAPKGVSRLMRLRNAIVKPLGLRTSPLGCPVSSLLSSDTTHLFANKFPVLAQSINDETSRAEVILGADDKHLIFRSSVGVEMIDDQQVNITLGIRVHCKNWFGKFYMAAIKSIHRSYIAPALLRQAVEYTILANRK